MLAANFCAKLFIVQVRASSPMMARSRLVEWLHSSKPVDVRGRAVKMCKWVRPTKEIWKLCGPEHRHRSAPANKYINSHVQKYIRCLISSETISIICALLSHINNFVMIYGSLGLGLVLCVINKSKRFVFRRSRKLHLDCAGLIHASVVAVTEEFSTSSSSSEVVAGERYPTSDMI